MEILNKGFSKLEIPEAIELKLEPAINATKISSYNGEMLFTAKKIYFLPMFESDALFYDPFVIDVAEIESYSKKGLAGFVITLKDGQTITLSNVFRKLREKIVTAIEERR